MKRSVIIVTPSFYDMAHGRVKIGGLESYVYELGRLVSERGYECAIVQYTDADDGTAMSGKNRIINRQKGSKSYNAHFRDLVKENPDSIFIIGTDQMGIRYTGGNAVQIQHGIAFDIPGYMISGFWGKTRWLQMVSKYLRCWRNSRRIKSVPKTVCVDYNTFNWYRTIGTIENGESVVVIPNYASSIISEEALEHKLQRFEGVKRIVFARRFVDYRGTLLFASVAEVLLERYDDISITFAGDGPLEDELRRRFDGNSRIEFTKFAAVDSVDFHSAYDVAVVPTIYSEGTSLSLCEAMAAGCFAVATHVGGITNIVLDGFNGLLCYPSEEELLRSLVRVIEMPCEEYLRIVRNGYGAVRTTFSKRHWTERWNEILNEMSEV